MREFEPSATRDPALLRPIEAAPRGMLALAVALTAVVAGALVLYVRQLVLGLAVTGMMQPVTWGFYIVSFVFFIGISHAGTLISAVLRMSHAEWRRPITRMAEVITAVSLAVGGLHPILDLGRPDRLVNVFRYGRLESPLLWDVVSILGYFAASTVYLFLPLIPDIALLRDRGRVHGWLYEVLSWGWQGTPEQWKVLRRAIHIMMIAVVPIMVSVHTVISYIFAMTVVPGWHSAIFGPYFVATALFSGIAALFVVMIVFRRAFGLEAYLRPAHFRQLARLMLVMSAVWAYFTFCEYLTGFYAGQPAEMKGLLYRTVGRYAPLFWLMVACNFVVPVGLLAIRRFRTVPAILAASLSVLVGVWLERLIIVVPSLENPRVLPWSRMYVPSFTEVGLLMGALALFSLGLLVFSRFFPVISVWEVQEGRERAAEEVAGRLRGYLPADSPGGSRA